MYQYQVREVDPLFPWWGSEWHIAESPYMLEDQTQGSRIDVQAYDKNGNVRTESLPATYDSMSRATPSRIAFIIACILLVFFVVRLLKRKRI